MQHVKQASNSDFDIASITMHSPATKCMDTFARAYIECYVRFECRNNTQTRGFKWYSLRCIVPRQCRIGLYNNKEVIWYWFEYSSTRLSTRVGTKFASLSSIRLFVPALWGGYLIKGHYILHTTRHDTTRPDTPRQKYRNNANRIGYTYRKRHDTTRHDFFK
jgi:hypothetical protein